MPNHVVNWYGKNAHIQRALNFKKIIKLLFNNKLRKLR